MKYKLIIILLLITNLFILAQTSIKMTGENSFVKREFIQNNEKFTFAILGDKTTGGVFNWPIFDRAVEEINLLQPDFVIMVGDMIQGVTTDTTFINEMWKEFKSHAEKLHVPLYVLPGNHDISNEVMYDYWNKKIGLRYYSFVHNNSLFMLLNTEEYKKTKDGELGKAQIDFIKEQLEANSNVNHTFIFLHRPIWYKQDSKHGGFEEWHRIAPWINDRDVTVFAGHWHNLVYNEKEGNRHIVLSATGGELKEKPLAELGYFHHYSLVTVDKDTSIISYIKPGSIFPEDIANKEFINKIENLVNADARMNVTENNILLTSQFSINNLLDKKIEYTFVVNNKENSFWEFDNSEFAGILKPNETFSCEFSSTNNVERSIPIPTIEYKIKLDGKLVDNKSITFAPGNETNWRYPDKVKVLGGFGLGIKEKPKTENDIKTTHLSKEVGWDLENKFISAKIDNGYAWQEIESTIGKTTLDNHFERIDFAFGFIKFTVESQDDISVLASLIPDNYAQVYLNGKLVLEGYPFKGVPQDPYLIKLDLKKGENNFLIKSANYYGNWYTIFKVSDPQNKLVFK